jgi:CoA:oxalate CoA-transferase
MPYKIGRSYYTPPFGPIKAKDGDIMTIFGTGPVWPAFCKMAGVEHLATDPRFATDEARSQNREEVGRLLDEAFSKKTRAEWQQIFRENKMRCDSCLTYQEVCEHPQLEANDIIFSTQHPTRGEIKMLGLPVKLKKTPGRPQGPSPMLGQHTEEILRKLGYSAEDISQMEAEKVIKVNRRQK